MFSSLQEQADAATAGRRGSQDAGDADDSDGGCGGSGGCGQAEGKKGHDHAARHAGDDESVDEADDGGDDESIDDVDASSDDNAVDAADDGDDEESVDAGDEAGNNGQASAAPGGAQNDGAYSNASAGTGASAGARAASGTGAAQLDDSDKLAVEQWAPDLQRAAKATGLDPYLLGGQVAAESSGDPNSRSLNADGTWDLGLMQISQERWTNDVLPTLSAEDKAKVKELTGKDAEQLDMNDPHDNVMGGAFELKKYVGENGGDIEKALGYYVNGGDPSIGSPTYVEDVLAYRDQLAQDGALGGSGVGDTGDTASAAEGDDPPPATTSSAADDEDSAAEEPQSGNAPSQAQGPDDAQDPNAAADDESAPAAQPGGKHRAHGHHAHAHARGGHDEQANASQDAQAADAQPDSATSQSNPYQGVLDDRLQHANAATDPALRQHFMAEADLVRAMMKESGITPSHSAGAMHGGTAPAREGA